MGQAVPWKEFHRTTGTSGTMVGAERASQNGQSRSLNPTRREKAASGRTKSAARKAARFSESRRNGRPWRVSVRRIQACYFLCLLCVLWFSISAIFCIILREKHSPCLRISVFPCYAKAISFAATVIFSAPPKKQGKKNEQQTHAF